MLTHTANVGGVGGGDVATAWYAVRCRFLLVEVTATTIQAQIFSGIATGRIRVMTPTKLMQLSIIIITTVCEKIESYQWHISSLSLSLAYCMSLTSDTWKTVDCLAVILANFAGNSLCS